MQILCKCNGAAVVIPIVLLAQTHVNIGCCIPLALRRVEGGDGAGIAELFNLISPTIFSWGLPAVPLPNNGGAVAF